MLSGLCAMVVRRRQRGRKFNLILAWSVTNCTRSYVSYVFGAMTLFGLPKLMLRWFCDSTIQWPSSKKPKTVSIARCFQINARSRSKRIWRAKHTRRNFRIHTKPPLRWILSLLCQKLYWITIESARPSEQHDLLGQRRQSDARVNIV